MFCKWLSNISTFELNALLALHNDLAYVQFFFFLLHFFFLRLPTFRWNGEVLARASLSFCLWKELCKGGEERRGSNK